MLRAVLHAKADRLAARCTWGAGNQARGRVQLQPRGQRAGDDGPPIRDTPPCALSADEYKLPTVPEGRLLVVIIRFEGAATEAVGLVLPQPANGMTANNGMKTEETNR